MAKKKKLDFEDLNATQKAEVFAFRQGRLAAFSEMWELFRDAPGGPMVSAMDMVGNKLAEADGGEDWKLGDQGSGD